MAQQNVSSTKLPASTPEFVLRCRKFGKTRLRSRASLTMKTSGISTYAPHVQHRAGGECESAQSIPV